MKKLFKPICLILIVLTVVSAGFSFHLYKELKAERESRAGQAMNAWNQLAVMATECKKIDSKETLDNFHFYENGILFAVEDSLSPNFSNVRELDTYHSNFLTTWYSSFVLDMYLSKDDEKFEEKLSLLKDITADIYDICAKALNFDDKSGYKPTDLIDSKSELYNELESMMAGLSLKYVDKLKEMGEQYVVFS